MYSVENSKGIPVYAGKSEISCNDFIRKQTGCGDVRETTYRVACFGQLQMRSISLVGGENYFHNFKGCTRRFSNLEKAQNEIMRLAGKPAIGYIKVDVEIELWNNERRHFRFDYVEGADLSSSLQKDGYVLCIDKDGHIW